MSIKVMVAALAVVFGLASAAQAAERPDFPSGSEPPTKASMLSARAKYKLQPGDHLTIKIFPSDEYIKGGDFEVGPEGDIIMPLVGKILLVDKTAQEAAQTVAEILDKDYIVDPQVVVEVQEFTERRITMLGQIRAPGSYKMPAGSSGFSLLQAVSLAGGFSEVANIKKVKILRKEGDHNKVIRVNAEEIISGEKPDVELEADDTIHVSESLF